MTSRPRILIVDDVPAFCSELKAIAEDTNAEVKVATSPLRAVRLARDESFDLLITTLVMKELGGLEVIRRVRGTGKNLPIMMVTGFGSEAAQVEAMRLGASDYLEKPVVPEELKARITRILDEQRKFRDSSEPYRLGPLITQDANLKAIFDMVGLIAASNSRVLILGETGTGKQFFARAIHERSARAALPFVEVNCAAIPDSLLESELFGHEKGAFTGATERRLGRFEQAANGTIFLDEIGEVSAAVQAKLLRVLQDGGFERVGSGRTLTSNARVVTATNRDLAKEADAGRFRPDLFYRLNVVSLTLPPLRERAGDVPLLANHFARRFVIPGKPPIHFSDAALRVLEGYTWPGNVRELEHFVERLAVLNPGAEIGVRHLPEKVVQAKTWRPMASSRAATYKEARIQFERQYVESLLAQSGGNMAEAARKAGLDRSQFFRMVRKHKLNE